MIFQHTWEKVLDGTKTQTRRLVKCNGTSRVGSYYKIEELLPPNDRLWWWWEEDRPFPGKGVYVVEGINGGWLDGNTPVDPEWTLKAKWVIGNTYAVQPGRGQKAVGRIRITGIRQERVQDITYPDAIAEGGHDILACRDYMRLWNKIHTKPGETWTDNPLVWVLSFELVR